MAIYINNIRRHFSATLRNGDDR